jgi:hypothetical protein
LRDGDARLTSRPLQKAALSRVIVAAAKAPGWLLEVWVNSKVASAAAGFGRPIAEANRTASSQIIVPAIQSPRDLFGRWWQGIAYR